MSSIKVANIICNVPMIIFVVLLFIVIGAYPLLMEHLKDFHRLRLTVPFEDHSLVENLT